MKFKEIEIYLNEESQEFREKVEALKEYCRKEGFFYSEGSYRSTDNLEQKILRITVKDVFGSEDLKKAEEYFRKGDIQRGKSLANRSKNLFEAYMKAEEQFKEERAYYEKHKFSSPEESKHLQETGQIMNYFKNRIFSKVMKAYKSLEEK